MEVGDGVGWEGWSGGVGRCPRLLLLASLRTLQSFRDGIRLFF